MKLLIVLLAVAAVMDLLQYRIPNWCIAVGMAAGLFLAWRQGTPRLVDAVIQAVMVFAVFYPFYLLGGMGAGDVKLFMLLGCYLDTERLLYCISAAMLIAGVAAVIKLISSKACRAHIKEVFYYVRKIIRTGALNDDIPAKSEACVVRLALPVLCSTLLCAGGLP